MTLRILISMLAWAVTVAATAGESHRPNVLVILADDLGYGDLSCYGADDLATPAIDALANAGMRFHNFYANCCVCSPTRAALLTGRYHETVGVPGVIRTHADDSWGYLAPEAVLVSDLLRQGGYQTALVGKWHLGLESPNTPNERGFEHFHGFLGDMMDSYFHHRRHGVNYMRKNGRVIDPEGHATDLFSQWACEFLRQQTSERPFFLYLAYNAPHTPIEPPPEWVKRVVARQTQIDEKRARLVALIEHMDQGIGQVMETLSQTGLADSTLVIFTSDNGGQVNVGANNGPLRDGKQSLYEGGIRVPMIAVWPGQIGPGTESDQIALTMDLLPTICQAADIPVRHAVDGRTILPTWLGAAEDVESRDLFFSRREGNLRYMGKTIHAVRRGDWKLVQNSPYAPFELYNLRDDPLETTDVGARNPRKLSQLGAALRRHIQRGGAVPWQPASRGVRP